MRDRQVLTQADIASVLAVKHFSTGNRFLQRILWHLSYSQGIKRPKKSERKRIRKGTDADRNDVEGGAPGRTAAEQIQEQLGFRNDGEGASLPISQFATDCVGPRYSPAQCLLFFKMLQPAGERGTMVKHVG